MRCDQRPLLEFLEARLGFRESTRVAEHVRGCPTCRERTRILTALIALHRDQAVHHLTIVRRDPPPRWGVLAAAFVAALLLSLPLLMPTTGSQTGPRQFATREGYPYFALETRAESRHQRRQEAFLAYSRKDYRRAAELFSQLPAESEILFFHGVSSYLAGDPEAALATLRKTLVLQSAWRVPSLWYQVHALLEMGRTGEALQLLNSGAFSNGRYRLEAALLSQRLQELNR